MKRRPDRGPGHSLVVMWCDDHVCGLMSVADQVRPRRSPRSRSSIGSGSKRSSLYRGQPAHGRAGRPVHGVDEYRAEMLPEDKVRL